MHGTDGFIRTNADEKLIAEARGLRQKLDMAAVQKVETAGDEDFFHGQLFATKRRRPGGFRKFSGLRVFAASWPN